MTDLSTLSAIEIGEHRVSLAQMLRRVHQRGRLLPLLLEVVAEELIRLRTEALGLRISDDQLQQAADNFRRGYGLSSAEQTRTWLASERRSVHDWEASLEAELLMAKLRDQISQGTTAEHFAAHRDGFTRARLRQIVVAREDLAQELLSQIYEEGADFAELARRHSQHSSRFEGGAVGEVFRRQLPSAVAEAVFAARAGEVVGPLATPQGFLLVLVEEVRPAELDPLTTAAIRQELFDAWLREQLRGVTITFPLLDAL